MGDEWPGLSIFWDYFSFLFLSEISIVTLSSLTIGNPKSDLLLQNWETNSCKTERQIQVQETLFYALADCEFVQDVVVSSMSKFGIECKPPNDNSPVHSVLWFYDDRVLGPCHPLITKCTVTNSFRWLITLEIVKQGVEK